MAKEKSLDEERRKLRLMNPALLIWDKIEKQDKDVVIRLINFRSTKSTTPTEYKITRQFIKAIKEIFGPRLCP